MAGVNAGLQDTELATAPPEAHGEIATQRDILYSAYHKALEQIEPADSAQGARSAQRVLTAAAAMQKKSASLALRSMMPCEEWCGREAEFSEIEDQVRELQQEGHPKAGMLRKVVESIRRKSTRRITTIRLTR